jgi:hypothetical protein
MGAEKQGPLALTFSSIKKSAIIFRGLAFPR